nr:putative polyprotein [Tanacetum cinerariifolium]
MIIKKDFEIVKAKVERKSLGLKDKKESSDEECSTSRSEDEEYAMAVRDFKKFFKRIGRFRMSKTTERKELKSICRRFLSDSGEEDDEKVNNETCLGAQASSEIITKNKRLKVTRNNLEKELSVLKEKVSTLEKNKRVDLECVKCHMLKIENEKLKEEVTRLNKSKKSTQCLNEMLSNQKPSGEKLGLGFNSFEASSSGPKEIKFMKAQKKVSSDGGPINMSGPLNVQAVPKENMGPPPGTTPGSEKNSGCSKHMTGNRKLFSTYKAYNGGNVIFGSNIRGNFIGKGEYSQWVERFMNYLEEQTDGEAMINSIKNGDQPLPRVTQVSIAGTSSTEQSHLKDKSMWSDQEKRIQKIDHLARSLLIQGISNDIYSLIDSNKTTKDL